MSTESRHGVAITQVHAPYPSYVYGMPETYDRMQDVLKNCKRVEDDCEIYL